MGLIEALIWIINQFINLGRISNVFKLQRIEWKCGKLDVYAATMIRANRSSDVLTRASYTSDLRCPPKNIESLWIEIRKACRLSNRSNESNHLPGYLELKRLLTVMEKCAGAPLRINLMFCSRCMLQSFRWDGLKKIQVHIIIDMFRQ